MQGEPVQGVSQAIGSAPPVAFLGGPGAIQSSVWCIAFLPDGKAFYSAGDAAILIRREADPDIWTKRERDLAGRGLYEAERRSYKIDPPSIPPGVTPIKP